MSGINSWGDAAFSEDYLPPPHETKPDENGVRIRTEYRFNDNGQKERVVTKIKTVKRKIYRNKAVLERKNWKQFGKSVLEAKGGDENVTYHAMEDVKILPADALEGDLLASTVTNAMNAPIMRSTPTVEPDMLDESGMGAGEDPTIMRRPMPSYMEQEDQFTLRVSSIDPDTTRRDLELLFATFGRLRRAYLATDPETKQHRGFAYVTFTNREDAQSALEALDKRPYGRLILRVEWSKPSKKTTAFAQPNLSRAFKAGWGKALPQGMK